ncbi:hypothetical protein Cob_v006758 [Colletotrichum orbiculare MAFF 240422]|uniref:Uncharacterized protein n=1 Tax=Colletotrichum orbiculare (strain 104-T / ATCC 96160 / CBS 514.97 / LARS 414 / MAFF 240422) TaxID=1213857 RepID=A0A484FUB9_COLOR|nr:hypothetical protein Cob_v006758 [Colletotrichum orbiculare MAFF 240422]
MTSTRLTWTVTSSSRRPTSSVRLRTCNLVDIDQNPLQMLLCCTYGVTVHFKFYAQRTIGGIPFLRCPEYRGSRKINSRRRETAPYIPASPRRQPQLAQEEPRPGRAATRVIWTKYAKWVQVKDRWISD